MKVNKLYGRGSVNSSVICLASAYEDTDTKGWSVDKRLARSAIGLGGERLDVNAHEQFRA